MRSAIRSHEELEFWYQRGGTSRWRDPLFALAALVTVGVASMLVLGALAGVAWIVVRTVAG